MLFEVDPFLILFINSFKVLTFSLITVESSAPIKLTLTMARTDWYEEPGIQNLNGLPWMVPVVPILLAIHLCGIFYLSLYGPISSLD